MTEAPPKSSKKINKDINKYFSTEKKVTCSNSEMQ